MKKIIDLLPDWLKKPQPVIPDAPNDDATRTPYLRVWAILRGVNLKELWPIFVSVPMIVFFAISGLLAWLALIVKFVVGIFGLS